MQGTAADIIKKAMISVDAWLRQSGTGAEIIMQVHDELVLEVPTAALAAVQKQVHEPHVRRRGAAGAPQGGRRHRRQLGRSPLEVGAPSGAIGSIAPEGAPPV